MVGKHCICMCVCVCAVVCVLAHVPILPAAQRLIDAIRDRWSGLKRFWLGGRSFRFVLTPDVRSLAHRPLQKSLLLYRLFLRILFLRSPLTRQPIITSCMQRWRRHRASRARSVSNGAFTCRQKCENCEPTLKLFPHWFNCKTFYVKIKLVH